MSLPSGKRPGGSGSLPSATRLRRLNSASRVFWALLALFDCAHLEEIYEGYQDQQPLGDDWRDRVALHQVHCLLVHVAVYGTGYRGETMRAVGRYV